MFDAIGLRHTSGTSGQPLPEAVEIGLEQPAGFEFALLRMLGHQVGRPRCLSWPRRPTGTGGRLRSPGRAEGNRSASAGTTESHSPSAADRTTGACARSATSATLRSHPAPRRQLRADPAARRALRRARRARRLAAPGRRCSACCWGPATRYGVATSFLSISRSSAPISSSQTRLVALAEIPARHHPSSATGRQPQARPARGPGDPNRRRSPPTCNSYGFVQAPPTSVRTSKDANRDPSRGGCTRHGRSLMAHSAQPGAAAAAAKARTGQGQIGVFLLDHHEIVRRGVRELLEAEPDIVVVGEAGTAASALARIRGAAPGCGRA